VALVLWGTDNLKTEGAPIAQALALMGASPRFDSYGRLAGAELMPLAELGRPRVDVVITLSGIFRDLLPLQIKLLAEAAFLAAQADEPPELNFVRKHALAYQAQHGGDMETASLRVFGNAEGAYGANVNPDRQRALGRRGRAGRDLLAPQGLRLRPQRPPGAAAPSCCAACCRRWNWPTRTWTRWNWASPPSTPTSTRWAASAAPSSAPRPNCGRRPRWRRSTSATRPTTASAAAPCAR
jgi:hypothetical protein